MASCESVGEMAPTGKDDDRWQTSLLVLVGTHSKVESEVSGTFLPCALSSRFIAPLVGLHVRPPTAWSVYLAILGNLYQPRKPKDAILRDATVFGHSLLVHVFVRQRGQLTANRQRVDHLE